MKKRGRHLPLFGSLLLSLLAGCDSGDDSASPDTSPTVAQPGDVAGTLPDPKGGEGVDAPAPTAPQDMGFVGLFEGDGVSLTLDAAGSELRGSLFFRGKRYSVTARVVNEALSGEFQSGDKTFAITAVHEGSFVILTSSNKTYTLQRQQRQNLLAQWAASGDAASSAIVFEGTYLGDFDGKIATLQLQEDGDRLTGTLTTSDHSYALDAQRGIMNATGTLRDGAMSADYAVEISASSLGKLRLAISPTPANGSGMVLSFLRSGS
jgi:hypothetical protein